MKEESTECPNLEPTDVKGLVLCYLNLVNTQNLIMPFLKFSVEFFLNEFLEPRKLDFREGIMGCIEREVYTDKPSINW
jgi:hypothetical protein